MSEENEVPSEQDLKKENLDEWVDECASCGRKVMVVRLSTIITVDSKRLVFCNLVCAKKVYKETR